MARTYLVDEKDYISEFGNATILYCSEKDEALYSEFMALDDEIIDTNGYNISHDTIELATSLEDIIKIRDWLNERIRAIKRKNKGE